VVLINSRKLSKRVFELTLILLIIFDSFFWTIGIQRPSRSDPYMTPPFIQFLKTQPQPYRIFSADGLLYPDIATAYELADVRWLYALVNKRAYTFSTRFVAEDVEGIRLTGLEKHLSTRMFNLLNVKYMLSQTRPDSGNVVYAGQDAFIVESKTVMPRAFVVYRVESANNFDTSLRLLSELPGADAGQVAVVEGLPATLLASINQSAAGSQPTAADFIQRGSGQVEINVDALSPGLLVVSDQYYPGWAAEIDGVSTPIYAVDGIFRGIFLPAGQHKIIFSFEPVSVKAGAAISLLALAIVVYSLSRIILASHKANDWTDNERISIL